MAGVNDPGPVPECPVWYGCDRPHPQQRPVAGHHDRPSQRQSDDRIERVADNSEDIAQYAAERIENNVAFSVQAIEELEELWKHTLCTFLQAVKAFQDSDKSLARQVCIRESEFDKLYVQARQRHIERLEVGICNPEANVISRKFCVTGNASATTPII
jgi:hypothetical protein